MFHGLTSFYRRFIKDFSTLTAPLNDLVRKNVVFKWGDMLEKASNELKKKLTNAPYLSCLTLIKLLKLSVMQVV